MNMLCESFFVAAIRRKKKATSLLKEVSLRRMHFFLFFFFSDTQRFLSGHNNKFFSAFELFHLLSFFFVLRRMQPNQIHLNKGVPQVTKKRSHTHDRSPSDAPRRKGARSLEKRSETERLRHRERNTKRECGMRGYASFCVFTDDDDDPHTLGLFSTQHFSSSPPHSLFTLSLFSTTDRPTHNG